jgi:2-C-methyl-D-erythritol 4-phosphate cytidylyltransferase
VLGGKERQQSVYNALASLEGKTDMVLIHDGARPLCPVELIRSVAITAKGQGAAILGVPSRSTLKTVVSNGSVVVKGTVPRETVWEAQTPQVFSFEILKAAHERALKDNYSGTDDSSLVERLGHVVQVVEGSTKNIKITTKEDLEQVQVLVAN